MQTFKKQMQEQFDKLQQNGRLFRSEITGSQVWEMYIRSFKDDPVFRDPQSSTHNCNLCNNFIRRYGNIIAVDNDYNIMTLWDFIPTEEEYIPVNNYISQALKKEPIANVFFETYDELNSLPYESIQRNQTKYKLGISSNVKRYTKAEAELYGVVKPDEIRTFHHLSLELDAFYVKRTGGSLESILASYRDDRNVFHRGMTEIPLDTLMLVKDLIIQGSLLDGTAHLRAIEAIIPIAEAFQNIPVNKREIWSWVNAFEFQHAKFKNTLIGVLCTELAEGMELNQACENWNKRVDPINYKKATAPITKKQIMEAKIFVDENGYTESFNRRPATIDDIKASEILHLNAEGGSKSRDIHLFDGVEATKSTRHKRSEFDKIEEVPIEKFMYEILPGCTSVEAFVLNSHEDNMVTLTTSKDKETKQIFKWNNPFSWTFNGNLAGKSRIKNAVKAQGGKVDGVLRFSIMWAEGKEDDTDLDAHCQERPGDHIYFGNRSSYKTGGNLDIDIINPQQHKRSGHDVVENITYPNYPSEDMTFEFWIHNYSDRNNKNCKAEIEFQGMQFQYDYPRPIPRNGNLKIATVKYTKATDMFEIKHHLEPVDGWGVDKTFYNITSNHFHKVNLVCLSPNHWDDNEVGNKYYFFFLEGAQAEAPIRSFHNENLKGDLVAHRKVMEVLANTTMVESTTNELSGIGFNSTVRDELVLRLKGTHKRVIKVKF